MEKELNILIEEVKKELRGELEIQKMVQEKAKEVVVVGRKKVNEMLKDKYIRQGKIEALYDLLNKLNVSAH
jgi:predicted XRE-type DNA-binding protein